MGSLRKISSAPLHTCIALILSFHSVPARAQNVATGVISGQVTDQQGAVIPGALLKLSDLAINSSSSTSSNEAGRYTFASVPPGNYELTVTKEGFAISKMTPLKVEVGQSLSMNVLLQVGQATTVVQVQENAGAELQIVNATIGSTITGDSLQLLPNLGRDASTLAVLQVGVTAFGNTAGANQDQNSFQLDGGNNSSDMDGNHPPNPATGGERSRVAVARRVGSLIPVHVESIEEF